MTDQKTGISINYMANLLSEDSGLIRLFRVYHPVYRMHVNIDVEYHDPSYHIIERYMDMLICGYSYGDRYPGNDKRRHYVKDRQELYQLLGLSGRASQIADEFYKDLYESGHFRVVDTEYGKCLEGTTPAFESVRLNEMIHSSVVEDMKIFDQYSLQIMPESFERIIKLSRTIEDTDIIQRDDLKSIWIPMRPEKEHLLLDINESLKRITYSGKKAIELGLPQGKTSISLTDHEIPEPMFFPYYIGVFAAGRQLSYRAFSMDTGEEIKGLTELYCSSEYVDIRKFIAQFIPVTNNKAIEHPFYKYKFREGSQTYAYLRKDDTLGAGITREYSTGNYLWNLTSSQVRELMDHYHRTGNAAAIRWLLNNKLFCLEMGETGKLLHVKLSMEQRKSLEQLISVKKQQTGKEQTTGSSGRSSEVSGPVHYPENHKIHQQSDYVRTLLQNARRYESGADTDRKIKAFEYYLKLLTIDKKTAYVPALKLAKNILHILCPGVDINNIDLYGNAADEKSRLIILFAAFCQAVDGNCEAQYQLYHILSTTELLQADEHTKIYWLEASAHAGNKEAMSRMGVLYYKGHYYPKDLNKAKIWLKRAADQNDAKALYNLGFIYYNGSGIEQVDIKKAVNCFKKAAELDFPPAFYTLSVLYEAGIGVEKNRTVSRQLMEKASALGYSKAAEKLSSI